jgi:hypothetical protein
MGEHEWEEEGVDASMFVWQNQSELSKGCAISEAMGLTAVPVVSHVELLELKQWRGGRH